jgi:hypothetical protein
MATTPSAVPANSSAQAMIDTFPDESDDDDLALITKDDDNVRLNMESLEMHIYRLIVANNLETVFPNTFIVFRIYLSLMISNSSGERSFSKLKLIKSQLRSCMIQKRLNSLTLLSIENNFLRNIDMSSLITILLFKNCVSMTYTRHLQNETSMTSMLNHTFTDIDNCSCLLAIFTL